MKKASLFLLLLLSLLTMSSCKTDKVIDIFIYDYSDTHISSLSNELKASLTDKYVVNLYDAKSSQRTQNTQIINAIDKNSSFLLVNLVDRLASTSIIEKAKSKNIPVIFYNREPLQNDIERYDNLYYVGSDSQIQGINQANYAHKLLNDPNNLNKDYDKNNDNILQCVFIQGEQGHQDTENRTEGCIKRLRELGYEVEVLDLKFANWKRKDGFDAMEELYNTHKNKIEFIFSNNDDMALGAIDYLRGQNLFETLNVPIVGVDGTMAGLQAIKNGYLSATTINDVYSQTTAIKKLIYYLEGTITLDELQYTLTKDRCIYVEGDFITAENIDKYMNG